MESQDSATEYLFKIWPVIEANKNRIIGGAVIVLVLVLVAVFYSWHAGQKEADAGDAFSRTLVSLQSSDAPAQVADQYLKLAGDYAGTEAGQRAQLQAASDLFASGNYADAQTQFQKFADEHSGSSLISIADLGVAASLAALGKNDAAAEAYKKVVDTYGDIQTQTSAKFALAGIDEQQGKTMDAMRLYEEVARAVPGSTLAQQSSLRGVELKLTLPPPAAPAAPFFAPTTPATMAPKTPPTSIPAKPPGN